MVVLCSLRKKPKFFDDTASEMTSEERDRKIHTDDVSPTRSV